MRDALATPRRPSRSARMRGAASVEYVLVTAIVVSALFLPVVGLGDVSLVEYVLDALKSFQQHTTFLLSLP